MAGLYTALQLAGDDETRLIHVLPTNGTETIFCELQVVALTKEPNFVALSYTWGPATSLARESADDTMNKATRPILCRPRSLPGRADDFPWQEFLITNNLYSFLLRVHTDRTLTHQFYWIDAICINQDDPQERTRQVGIMTAIYQSANIVYAWLGEEDENTQTCFDLIRALSARCSGNERHFRINGLRGITPAALSDGGLTTRLGVRADVVAWKALALLFDRRYFTRVWTIQEITLAKTLVAYCGSNSIEWEDIVKVSEFLTMTTWTKWIAEVTASRSHYHSVPNILDANKSSRDILYSLIRFRRFASIDPRDKVYALLGLAEESIRGKRRLTPVYGKRSVAETYTLAAIQILEDSDDLLLLACAEGDNFRNISNLPSWVPDWSCARPLGLGVTGYKRYSAAATIPRFLEIDEWERCVRIKGFRFDDIVHTGESKQDVVNNRPFPKWLAIVNSMPLTYHTGQSRSEVFWRTLISDTAGAPPIHPAPERYRSTYLTWIRAKVQACVTENTADAGILKAYTAAFELLSLPDNSFSSTLLESQTDFQRKSGAECSDLILDSNDYETLFSYSRHLRPFLTSRRYLGIGSESLLEGDSVWIVQGSRVPLILRQVSSGSFSLVGGAYVHGIMRGEALTSEPIFSTITIT